MASIPSLTAISVDATNIFYGTKLQTGSTTSVVDPRNTSNSAAVDIYDGNTTANKAALASYLEGVGLYQPSPTTGAPSATIATIQNGSGPSRPRA
jgi:hypothetical protein